MTAVVGRAWGWVRSWGSKPDTQHTQATIIAEEKKPSRGWTSWLWLGWSRKSDLNSPVEEFWEAPEKIQPMEVEELKAGKDETDGSQPRWWSKLLPTYYIYWPKKAATATTITQQPRKRHESDIYGTPPPSPTPPVTSPFRLFVSGWQMEIIPEHYDICFNFLRHLFDLFVVGFLWTVSTPSKIVVEILGVQGALRLWFHGMAMFFVATIGMAGLLGLIREYLAQFTLVYGIIQALVISVSMKQSVLFGGIEEEQKKEEEVKEKVEVKKDTKEHRGGVKPMSPKEKLKKIS
ncbi:uncharacterized protein C6orf47 homolog [Boleophthalmus pectinirostris]|uniref:uncharacterized protein C6orf47 homolog n=1 Tax=Boleophthalmus pectinirostris TaxID=150288 RepID=UPI00242F9B00|nr:uncharacterized protein C6orf47 homolog [Boleophthalmus pectinirostris]XP_055013296.1 uncharacterized protein C6orf47 homolog [Boleophthalmus pectinirostris]